MFGQLTARHRIKEDNCREYQNAVFLSCSANVPEKGYKIMYNNIN